MKKILNRFQKESFALKTKYISYCMEELKQKFPDKLKRRIVKEITHEHEILKEEMRKIIGTIITNRFNSIDMDSITVKIGQDKEEFQKKLFEDIEKNQIGSIFSDSAILIAGIAMATGGLGVAAGVTAF